jgi:hypothetical protein
MPAAFRHLLVGHEAHSVQWAGFSQKKNGELLRLAELAGYDVLLTVDQGIQHEQNFRRRNIALIIMRAANNDISLLAPMADRVSAALARIQRGDVVVVG